MASSINASNPVTGSPTTASVRANFLAAKDEIEALQALQNPTTTTDNALVKWDTGTAAFVEVTNVTIDDNGNLTASGKVAARNAQELDSVRTGAFTAAAGKMYACNTTSSSFTATLPASPSAGDIVTLSDYAGSFSSNNLTVGRNGNNILAAAEDLVLDVDWLSVTLVYVDSTAGWIFA